MAPSTIALRRASWLRPKYFVFAFIGLMMAYVLRHNESFLVNGKDPVWQHYQSFSNWMTRSYAVAIVFLEVRFTSGLLGYDDSLSAGETIVWMCVAFSLLFADLVLHWQDLTRSRPVPARPQPAR